ncbi:MAG: hypothetical protein II702_08610 [Clostridia bacterium]|jgi:hypothetical protein|nr:hypothetical protein [Clostridia bacterium]
MKKKTIKRALSPSERESITGFSDSFGSGREYEMRRKRRKILTAVFTVFITVLLITIGYFVTETLLNITELPVG